MFHLATGPKTAGELTSIIIYDGVDKYRLPESTARRLLKRLVEIGLIEVYRGIDKRRRYYRLTATGESVIRKLTSLVVDRLRRYAIRGSSGTLLDIEKLREEAYRLGVSPRLLVEVLGLKKVKSGDRVYYAIPPGSLR